MAELEVIHKSGPVLGGPDMGTVTASTEIKKGDAVWHNGTSWALADASDATKPAQGFALNDVDSAQDLTQRLNVSRHVYVIDEDAPFTAGDAEWLSETAGAITHTRPTTAAALKQPLGEALTTKICERVIRPSSYVHVPIVLQYATSANALLDSGNFAGATVDAQNEVATFFAVVPENAIRLEKAAFYLAAETDATPTFDLTVGSAIDGAQHDAVTAAASFTDSAREGAAAADMQETDITSAFDATSIIRPGAALGIKATKDDSGTVVSIIFGGYMVFEVA